MVTRDVDQDGLDLSEDLAPVMKSPRGAPSVAAHERCTMVVAIHGNGDRKRTSTQGEAVNTLASEFNHQVELAYRREGPESALGGVPFLAPCRAG